MNSGEAGALLISVEATNEQALAAQCFSDQATATITRYIRVGPVLCAFRQAPPAVACQHRPTYQFSVKPSPLSVTVFGVVGSWAVPLGWSHSSTSARYGATPATGVAQVLVPPHWARPVMMADPLSARACSIASWASCAPTCRPLCWLAACPVATKNVVRAVMVIVIRASETSTSTKVKPSSRAPPGSGWRRHGPRTARRRRPAGMRSSIIDLVCPSIGGRVAGCSCLSGHFAGGAATKSSSDTVSFAGPSSVVPPSLASCTFLINTARGCTFCR